MGTSHGEPPVSFSAMDSENQSAKRIWRLLRRISVSNCSDLRPRATMAQVQVGQCKFTFEVSSRINPREVQNSSAHVRNHKVQYHKCVRTYHMTRVFSRSHLWNASPPIAVGNKNKYPYLRHSKQSGRKITCAAEKPNSQAVELREPVKGTIGELLAANEKLQARVKELESALAAREVATPTGVEGVLEKLSEVGIQGVQEEDNGGLHEASILPSAAEAIPKFAQIEWPSPTDTEPFWKKQLPKRDSKLQIDESEENHLDANNKITPDTHSTYVIHVTSEMAPLAKVGGLGDVVTGLARACLERGHKVEVMLPFYEMIKRDQIEDLVLADSYNSYHRGDWVPIQVWRGKVTGVPVLFIDPQNHFFKGAGIYGGSYDELEAYLFFSRACLEWMQVTGSHPDIIHVHEWQISGLPILYWDMYHNLSLKNPRLVLTIHNMEHFGECRVEQLNMCGLDGNAYRSPDKAIDERTIGHNPERLSLLKGGIVYSNAVTTVSPTYVNETMCSGWLSGTLMKHRNKYLGILNGIDTTLWDPATDVHIPASFRASDTSGKRICKQFVQRGIGLEFDERCVDTTSQLKRPGAPLVVCITRLVAQKGIHLIRHAIFRVAELGGQFVLLGTSPDARIQSEFEHLANQFKDSKNVRLLLTYSEDLAHMLYAASDILLVPSMFEPCGLTQMIGMRYGSIPVVRRTGGLADTVFDVDDQSQQEKGNGFVFDGIDEGSLNTALDRALRYYRERPEWWSNLTSKVMKLDFSWNKSAGKYLNVYNSVRVK